MTLKDCFAKRRERIRKREELAATFMKLRRDAIEYDWTDDEREDFAEMSDREFLDLHCPKQPWRFRLRHWWNEQKDIFKNKFRGVPGMQGYCGMMGAPGRHACEILCPHCGTWNSEVGNGPMNKSESKWHIPSLDSQYEGQPFGTWHCGRCGDNSEWFIGAPVLIAAKDVHFAGAVSPKHPTL